MGSAAAVSDAGESVTGSPFAATSAAAAGLTVDTSPVWVNSSGLLVTTSCTTLSSVRLIGACISELLDDNADSLLKMLEMAASGLTADGADADAADANAGAGSES